MDFAFLTLVVVVLLALTFDFINGFHDTANAIATSVATRVLTPGTAVLMAAVLNFVGAITGSEVAKTIWKDVVSPDFATQGLVVAALLSAITWNLITWYWGIPSSSSHALVFSLVGAGLASGGLQAIVFKGVSKTLQGLVLSPLLGFSVAALLMLALLWLVSGWRPYVVSRTFGRLQILSAAWMAYSHGGNDAQKTMGVITLALASYYHWGTSQLEIPLWVKLAAATAMGLGTAIGGWRIIQTIGLKVIELRPIHGFVAEMAAGTLIEVASRLGIPVSTTHTISSSILGVGATRRFSATKWGVAGRIVSAWVITIPACTALGWLVFMALHGLGVR